ncbi:MAG: DUF2783 domain-containing protein [Acidobacteriota bacterium]
MPLDLEPRIDDPDELFEALVRLTEGLSSEEAERAQNALLLLLANQVDDLEAVREAIQLARESARVGGAALAS